MQQNELATMPISDCIVMVRSHNPFYAKKYPAFDHPNFRFTGLSYENNRADIRQIRSVTVAEFEAEQKIIRSKAIKRHKEEQSAASKPKEKPDVVIYKATEPIVTAEDVPTSYEDILEMDAEISSVSGSETYAEDTHHYGIPDDEIESRDMGEAIRQKEEEYEDEETEIAPAVIDENGETVFEPEPEGTENVSYYGEPDDEPEYNPDFPDEDYEVRVCTDEELPDSVGSISTPSLLGETFDE